MLSSLFSEQGIGGGLVEGPSLVSRPPSPRPPCNLVGLDNQGSTCYLNSLIQQLFQTPEVLDGLFALTPEALGADGPEESMRRIPLELQRLFARMLRSNEAAVSTEQLTRSFGWTGDETFQQHDVQELNRILFAAIEASLIGLPEPSSSLIRSLYYGTLVNQITCESCGGVSEREEDYQDLCVPVAGHPDLTSSLIAAYVQCETLEGDNAYRCERCASLVTASKGTKIRSLPPILTISLLRFNFDLQRLERYKETGSFEFPMVLDMAPFVEKEPASPEAYLYDLVGVVIHRGSTYGGHYHAYIRDVLGIGRWSSPEEEPIRVVDDSPQMEVDSPQELITLILGKVGRNGMQIGKLGGEVAKVTGNSWNGRFRSQHGPLVKFIKRHDHLWGYNTATQWAWLLETEASMGKKSSESTKDGDGVDKDTSSNTSAVAVSPNSASSITMPSSDFFPSTSIDDEVGWFDFNDAFVSPIRQSKIASQFAGRESAYLLTYRSRALQGAKDVEPPSWLREELEERNREWERQREEYDLRTNSITLHLLDSRHVSLATGGLELRHEPEAPTLRIDWRRPLRDLFPMIPDLDSFASVSLLHKGMEISLFVKEELKKCDPDHSLNQLGVGNGSQLLLWDGVQLNGKPWPHAHQKPFKILAECPFLEPEFSMRVHGMATPLCDCLSQHWSDLDLSCMRVGQVKLSEGGEPHLQTISPEDLTKTADQLGFKGEVHLMLSDLCAESPVALSDAIPALSQNVRFTVLVKNNLAQDENPTLHHVSFDSSTTVLDFRKAALQSCGFSALDVMAAECRLRLASDSDDLGPPLIDDSLLVESGIDVSSNKAHVVLERGPPVPADHIFVTVVPWDAHGECSLVVSRDLLMKDLKGSAASALLSERFPDLTPDKVSLQLLSWCDAPTRSFRDEDQTVQAAQLSNGDRLMLSRDVVLPKGMINIPVRARTLAAANQLSAASLEWRPEALEKNVEALSLEEGMKDLGEMTVALDTPVGELKVLVMAKMRETDGEHEAVEMDRVRLRAVEEGVLRAVLKSPNQSVQRARLSCARPLCVEILPQPQILAPSDLLLAVRLRNDASSSYSPAFDLIFPTVGGAPPANLHSLVRDSLSSDQPFRLAKRMTNRRRWLPLPTDDVVSSNVPQGKRRPVSIKVSLLRAPYGLRDGDVIGVKFVEDAAAPVTPEDFDSAEDVAWRKLQEEEAMERRNKRNTGSASWFVGGAVDGGHSKRGPEVPLVIRVQKF